MSVFLPGKSHGQRNLGITVHGVARVKHDLVSTPPPLENPSFERSEIFVHTGQILIYNLIGVRIFLFTKGINFLFLDLDLSKKGLKCFSL